ncbi:MAG: hypothetical protein LBT38_12610, partial [Deltaproteobacteria bacterium]|nr:hypothetical protein [Deltaproteobacteria bacterium]
MANDESLALEPDLASPDSLPSELADSMASPDENALVLDAPPEAIPPPNALALDAPSEAVLSPEALNQKAVQALAEANLNWVRQTQNIWDDHDDTPEIHALIRAKFNRRLIALKKSRATSSWPGLVIIGNPGAGKTHLLGSFYRQTLAKKGFFLVVDMIGVNAFFDTVVEHLLNSLAAPDPDGRTQALRLAENILTISLDPGQTLPANFDEWLASAPFEKLCQIISSTIKRLHLRSGIQNLANRFGDIIRALFFFCSKSQTISNYGRLWLQGLLDRQNQTLDKLRFSGQRLSPDIVVQGLTWLMSLNGSFSVLAIDQLDALIKLHAITLNAASAGDNSGFLAANRVLNEVSAGLGTLINITYKSTTVLSLLQDTWQSLLKFGLTPAIQRYNAPWFLNKIEKGEHMADLLAKRLAPSFLAHDLVPPYPSWPFALPALEEMAGRLDPRRLLIKCEKYLDNCL